MTKDERIELKRAELMQSFETLQPEQLKVAKDLISQAAFMAVELEDLAEIISSEGMTEEYTNGANQSGRKISSNAKMYSALIGKYNAIVSKLLKIVPAPEKKPKVKTVDEIAAEREAAERRERYDRQQRRNKEIGEAFAKAYKGKPQTPEAYRAFKAEWERQHAE